MRSLGAFDARLLEEVDARLLGIVWHPLSVRIQDGATSAAALGICLTFALPLITLDLLVVHDACFVCIGELVCVVVGLCVHCVTEESTAVLRAQELSFCIRS